MEADPLSDVLRTVRLTGAVFFLVDASAPWTASAPLGKTLAPLILPGAQQIVSFHVVTEGRCFAELDGRPPVPLEAGDVILIPHGDSYALTSTPGAAASIPADEVSAFFREMAAGRLPPIVTEGGGGRDRIRVVCGFLGCDVAPFNPALASMPPLVLLRRPERPTTDRLDHLIEFALSESREARSGSRCVLLRLSELMFVEVVRRHLSTQTSAGTGWLAGLRDPDVGRAIARIHEQPALGWTLESLAREVGVSRSTLAERFTHMVGHPPMQYVARWRMQLATRLLAERNAKVSAIAAEVGYASEAAFSRAFRKIVGASPSAWRRRGPDQVAVARFRA
jgi:AraC-like DNA-binding protein